MSPKPKQTLRERSILDMSAKQARAFLLKPESYCRLDLPPYFDFGAILRSVSRHLAEGRLIKAHLAREHSDANYTIHSNKDGRYAWRPFQLVHPALHVDVVNLITQSEHWATIVERFKEFRKNPQLRCLSIPVASLTKRSDQSSQVRHWWQGIEQASLDLALDFEFVFHADIADCYSSMYTHSVAWALHGKGEAKSKKRDKGLLGNGLDGCIQNMSYGQTNGIPQGSVLFDLVAEMILGYADEQLLVRLDNERVQDFQILRYRDDYRVFVNSTQAGEAILKALTEVLMTIGLKLNTSKTTGFKAVIAAAVKSDKRAWMASKQVDVNLQKHLLLIHGHSLECPNAGSVFGALDDFYKRLLRVKSIQNPSQLVSIAVDIGCGNPRCFPICAAIVSKILSMVPTKKGKLSLVDRVRRKLARLPNNGHLEVWLQRITYPVAPDLKFLDNLCRLVQGEKTDLWNSSWVEDVALRSLIDSKRIVNKRRLAGLRPVVRPAEVSLFY